MRAGVLGEGKQGQIQQIYSSFAKSLRYVGEIETGKIKSWNDRAVFVVYRCNKRVESVFGIHGCGN